MVVGAPSWAPANAVQDPTSRALARRYGAYIIDAALGLIVVPIVVVAFFALSSTRAVDDANAYCNSELNPNRPAGCIYLNDHKVRVLDDGDIGALFLIGGGAGLLLSLNQWVLQGVTGATIGKHLLKLRVVRADGSITGFWPNALRTLLLFVDSACYGVPGIVSSSVTHPHKRIGDMAAGTYVVPLDAVGTPVPQPAPVGAYTYAYAAYPPAAAPPYGYGAPAPPPPPAAPQPQWDPARNAWVLYDPSTGAWQQWDASASAWRPLT